MFHTGFLSLVVAVIHPSGSCVPMPSGSALFQVGLADSKPYFTLSSNRSHNGETTLAKRKSSSLTLTYLFLFVLIDYYINRILLVTIFQRRI